MPHQPLEIKDAVARLRRVAAREYVAPDDVVDALRELVRETARLVSINAELDRNKK